MDLILNINGVTVAGTTRRITTPGRQCFVTQYRVNIAAGTQVGKLQAKVVSTGTLNIHNVQIMGQSTLGINDYNTATAFSTSSTSYVDVVAFTAALVAGDWIIVCSGDCTPP
jgi:hypothetical protein